MRYFQLAILAAVFCAKGNAAPQNRYTSKYPQHPQNMGYGGDYPKYWEGQIYNPVDYPPPPPPQEPPRGQAGVPPSAYDSFNSPPHFKQPNSEPSAYDLPKYLPPPSKHPAKEAIAHYSPPAEDEDEDSDDITEDANELIRLNKDAAATNGKNVKITNDDVEGDEGSTFVYNNPSKTAEKSSGKDEDGEWDQFSFGVVSDTLVYHDPYEGREEEDTKKRKTNAMGKIQKMMGGGIIKRDFDDIEALEKRDGEPAEGWPDHIREKAAKMMEAAARMQNSGAGMIEADTQKTSSDAANSFPGDSAEHDSVIPGKRRKDQPPPPPPEPKSVIPAKKHKNGKSQSQKDPLQVKVPEDEEDEDFAENPPLSNTHKIPKKPKSSRPAPDADSLPDAENGVNDLVNGREHKPAQGKKNRKNKPGRRPAKADVEPNENSPTQGRSKKGEPKKNSAPKRGQNHGRPGRKKRPAYPWKLESPPAKVSDEDYEEAEAGALEKRDEPRTKFSTKNDGHGGRSVASTPSKPSPKKAQPQKGTTKNHGQHNSRPVPKNEFIPKDGLKHKKDSSKADNDDSSSKKRLPPINQGGRLTGKKDREAKAEQEKKDSKKNKSHPMDMMPLRGAIPGKGSPKLQRREEPSAEIPLDAEEAEFQAELAKADIGSEEELDAFCSTEGIFRRDAGQVVNRRVLCDGIRKTRRYQLPAGPTAAAVPQAYQYAPAPVAAAQAVPTRGLGQIPDGQLQAAPRGGLNQIPDGQLQAPPNARLPAQAQYGAPLPAQSQYAAPLPPQAQYAAPIASVKPIEKAASAQYAAPIYKSIEKIVSVPVPGPAVKVFETVYQNVPYPVTEVVRGPEVTQVVQGPGYTEVVEKEVPYPVTQVVNQPPVTAIVTKIVQVPVTQLQQVSVPYAVTEVVEKEKPYAVTQTVEKEKPYAVTQTVEKEKPYAVTQIVEKEKPYAVTQVVEKEVPYAVTQVVEKEVPYAVTQVVEKEKPYAVTQIVEKEKPYAVTQVVEKSYPVTQIVEKPYTVTNVQSQFIPVTRTVEKAYQVTEVKEYTQILERPVTMTEIVNQQYAVTETVEKEKAYPVTETQVIQQPVPYPVTKEVIISPVVHTPTPVLPPPIPVTITKEAFITTEVPRISEALVTSIVYVTKEAIKPAGPVEYIQPEQLQEASNAGYVQVGEEVCPVCHSNPCTCGGGRGSGGSGGGGGGSGYRGNAGNLIPVSPEDSSDLQSLFKQYFPDQFHR